MEWLLKESNVGTTFHKKALKSGNVYAFLTPQRQVTRREQSFECEIPKKDSYWFQKINSYEK
jgi:hypothetical protein